MTARCRPNRKVSRKTRVSVYYGGEHHTDGRRIQPASEENHYTRVSVVDSLTFFEFLLEDLSKQTPMHAGDTLEVTYKLIPAKR